MEIGHVLFIDIVGYSKLLINEQSGLLHELKGVVRATEPFRAAEAEGKLISLPTGDGMALVFRNSPEAPAQCALAIGEALKSKPDIQLRMGIHSGPVNEVADVNERANIAGAGINIAQRVMDCGDAGHILLSKRVADDLEQYPQWRDNLHDLGECEVKHGVRLSVVNLYTGEVGNSERPVKFRPPVGGKEAAARRAVPRWAIIAAVGLIVSGLALGLLLSRSKPSPSAPMAAATVPEKSIAVLPFENLSDEKQNAYFADGVQDEILTDLAKIADLKVISRTSVMQYRTGAARNLREIGKELGVAHLLEGSVQRAGGKVRVNAQLIDARTDTHSWANTYDRDLADVFAIQSEIAKAIVEQLQAKISASEKAAIERPPTDNLAAYDLYNHAKALIATSAFGAGFGDKLSQAAELLDQAVAKDPRFMIAYCELAGVHDFAYFSGFDHTPVRLALAEKAVQSALRLRPGAGEGHLAQAQHLYQGYLEFDRALVELAIARRTLPNDPRVFELAGYIIRRQGRQEEGLRNLQRALELDPRNFATLQQIALSYEALRRYPEMVDVLDRALAIVPNDTDTRVTRAQVHLDWQADPRPLQATIEALLIEQPEAGATLADSWLNLALCEHDLVAAGRALTALGDHTFGPDAVVFSRKFGEGLVARVRGDAAGAQAAFVAARAQQEKLIAAQGDYAPALCVLGMIDAGLGRKEDALREGRRAIQLLPVERDALNGVRVREFLAIIYSWTGEKNLACQQLATIIKSPGSASYGQLRLHPYWDPLRGDPRFEEIVASLAPKDVK